MKRLFARRKELIERLNAQTSLAETIKEELRSIDAEIYAVSAEAAFAGNPFLLQLAVSLFAELLKFFSGRANDYTVTYILESRDGQTQRIRKVDVFGIQRRKIKPFFIAALQGIDREKFKIKIVSKANYNPERSTAAAIAEEPYDFALPPADDTIEIFGLAAGQISNWGRDLLNPEVFYEKTRGENIAFFVADTAGLFDHDDLTDNCLPEYNRNFSDAPTGVDYNGHGTHCAGIIAGTDNNYGVVGIAPKGKLIALKVMNDAGLGRYDWIIRAIYYAADLNLGSMKKVISLSLAGAVNSAQLEKAIEYAVSKGCFFFAAAGNSGYKDGENSMGYPARYQNVIAVGSTRNRKSSAFSSGGPEIDIAAPGSNIFSTFVNQTYAHKSGTSMACPAAAAIGGLILSMRLEIKTQKQLEAFMILHATDIMSKGFDEQSGHGLPIADNYLPEKTDEKGTAAVELFKEIFEARDIKRMRESVLLKMDKYLKAGTNPRLRRNKNAKLIIEKMKL